MMSEFPIRVVISVRELFRLNNYTKLEVIAEQQSELQLYIRNTYSANNQVILQTIERRITKVSENLWRQETRRTNIDGAITYESRLINSNN